MKKNILKRLSALFADEEVYTDVKTEDGKILRVYSGSVAVDVAIEEVTEEGMLALEDAEYKLEDGSTLVVVAGMITEIKEGEKPEDTTTEDDVNTEDMSSKGQDMSKIKHFAIIKQISKWEMTVDNETFEVGSKVTMSYEDDGNLVTYSAYAGTYELEDGRTITLDNDGVVVLITDATGTVAETPEVGSTIDGETPAPAVDEATPTDVEETMAKIEAKFASQEAKYKELEAKYNELAKSPGAVATKTKEDFKSEEKKVSKPKSVMHELIEKGRI